MSDVEFLRYCRTLAGLTIANLAERAKLHEVTLARIEGGLRCTPETTDRIMRATLDALDERVEAIHQARTKLIKLMKPRNRAA